MRVERSMEAKQDADDYDVIRGDLVDVKERLAEHIRTIDALADRLFGILSTESQILTIPEADNIDESEPEGIVGEIAQYTKDTLALLRTAKTAFSRLQK